MLNLLPKYETALFQHPTLPARMCFIIKLISFFRELSVATKGEIARRVVDLSIGEGFIYIFIDAEVGISFLKKPKEGSTLLNINKFVLINNRRCKFDSRSA